MLPLPRPQPPANKTEQRGGDQSSFQAPSHFALDRLIPLSKAGGEGSCSHSRNIITRCFFILLKHIIHYFYFTFQCLDLLTWKSTWEASQDAHNRSKNRYCNIVACKLKMLSLYGYTIALAVKCETIFQFFYSVFLCECLRQF